MLRIGYFMIFLLIPGFPVAQEMNLDYYIKRSLENSPAIIDIQNQIRSAKIDSMRIGAGLKPQVNLVSNNYYAPIFNGWGYDEVKTDIANINAQVMVSGDITGAKRRDNQFGAVAIRKQSLDYGRKISERQLIREVTDQYISCWGLGQQVIFEKNLISFLQDEEVILKKLTGQNIYRQTDFLNFRITLKQQDLLLAQLQNQYKTSLAALNMLCGISDTTTYALGDPGLTAREFSSSAKSLYYQPFLTDSLKLINENGLIQYSYKPRISIFGDAGYFSSLNLRPYRNFGAGAGINVTVPLYDGHQKKMQLGKNLIAEQTRQGYRDFYVRQYNQQVGELTRQLNANLEMEGLIAQQVRLSRQLTDANHTLLENGMIQVSDYLIVINNYLSARQQQVQNNVEKYQIINQINYWSTTK